LHTTFKGVCFFLPPQLLADETNSNFSTAHEASGTTLDRFLRLPGAFRFQQFSGAFATRGIFLLFRHQAKCIWLRDDDAGV
jgi:hypothetical protein